MATKTYGANSIGTNNQANLFDINGYISCTFTPDDWGGNIDPQSSPPRALYYVTRQDVRAKYYDLDASPGDRSINIICGSSKHGTDKANSPGINTVGNYMLSGTYNYHYINTGYALGSTTEYYAGFKSNSTSGAATERGVASGETTYANATTSWANYQIYLKFTYYGLPNATSSISATSTGQNSVTVSFNSIAASGVAGAATGYKVQYKPATSSTWIDFTTTSSTSVSVTGLSAGTSYNFRVAGVISSISNIVSTATGTWSSTASATTESDVPPVPAPTWSGSFNSGTINTTYSTDFARAIGHDTGNIYIVSGSLPPGLNGSPSGEYYYVSGTPTVSGSYSFTLRATNAGGTSDQAYSIYIAPLAAPTWVDQVLATSGTVGDYYSDSVSATNVTSWSYSGILPPGTVFSNGSIYGTLTTAGSFSFIITASNASGSTQRSFTIIVDSALLNGGSRMTGSSSSTPLTIYKRYNGSSWTDLTVAKRYNGSTWEDI